MKTNIRFDHIALREMLQTKVVEKIKKKNILCSMIFFFENHAVYEIMRKHLVEAEGHSRKYGECALHAGYLRLQTHILVICNTSATVVGLMRLYIMSYYIALSCLTLRSLYVLLTAQFNKV